MATFPAPAPVAPARDLVVMAGSSGGMDALRAIGSLHSGRERPVGAP